MEKSWEDVGVRSIFTDLLRCNSLSSTIAELVKEVRVDLTDSPVSALQENATGTQINGSFDVQAQVIKDY